MNHHSIATRLPGKCAVVTAQLARELSTVSPDEWARQELPRRRREDALFPTLPVPYSEEWYRFTKMKTKRRLRRAAAGLSRSQAAYYLNRAGRVAG